MQHRYSRLALYNAWANRRLYDAVASLNDTDYRADRGAFFKSLHGTLNHLLVGDRIWMRRFTGEGDAPTRLDAILHEDFHDLRRTREIEDRRIQTYVDSLDESALNASFSYSTITNPAKVEQVLSEALDHFFNHQTHHRGQAHCLLTAITGTAPSLDLVVLQREQGWAKKQ
ncbi:MAG: damage-inducible protein DinB [Hyphomicrobiales bacterium]|nr:damage-inducible protein DinB [Hyphomicrobiales bacterium]